MPRRPKTHKPRDPQHTYFAPDDIYIPAQAAAEDNGEALAQVIRRCLVQYTRATERRTGKHYTVQS